MKKITAIFLVSVMMLTLMAGCTGGGTTPTEATQPTQETTQPTQEPTQPTQMTTEPTQMGTATGSASQILNTIWSSYGEDERFACYGGTVEHSVSDAPGDLDMNNTEEITSKYLLPADQLADVESGASLVHLMNSNIFTAAAFKVKDGANVRDVAKALRDNIQKTQWICGQPDHLLVAEVEGHLLMAFAAKEGMETFRQKLSTAYSGAKIIYDEAVTA